MTRAASSLLAISLAVGPGIPPALAQLPTPSAQNATIEEGNSGTRDLIFTVTLSNPFSEVVTVHFQVSEHPSAPANLRARIASACAPGFDFVGNSRTLTFQPGTTTQTVPVPICGDTEVESDEDFLVRLSRTSPGPASSPFGVGGKIKNDDVSISVTDLRFPEGDGGHNATVHFALSGPAPTAISFQPTLASIPRGPLAYPARGVSSCNADLGDANFDFVAPLQPVSIPAGGTTAQLPVRICGDQADEPDEIFVVVIPPISGVTLADDTGQVTIVDDD